MLPRDEAAERSAPQWAPTARWWFRRETTTTAVTGARVYRWLQRTLLQAGLGVLPKARWRSRSEELQLRLLMVPAGPLAERSAEEPAPLPPEELSESTRRIHFGEPWGPLRAIPIRLGEGSSVLISSLREQALLDASQLLEAQALPGQPGTW